MARICKLARSVNDNPNQTSVQDDQAHNTLNTDLLVRLWSFLLPYKWSVIACIFVSIGIGALKLCQPILIHSVIANEVAAGDVSGISKKMLIFFGLILMTFAFEVLFNWTTGVIGQKSMHDLRLKIFRHVAGLDVAYFDRTPVGRLVTRMTSDVASLNDMFSSGVIAIMADTMMLAGLVVVMMVYSLPLSLVVMCAVPFMLVTVALFRRYSRKWFLEARARLAKVNSFLQENITGMQTVQSLRRETRNHAQFEGLNDEYRESQIHTIMAFAMFFPTLNLILYVTLTSIIWFGGRGVIEGSLLGGKSLEFATLLLFVQCVHMLFAPLRSLSEKYNILQAAMASSSRIFRLLDEEPAIVPPTEISQVPELKRKIEFENICFEYVPGERVLKNVSFEMEKGKSVAIVGATGSGKSTLVNLLLRFYDVNEGRITIDGVDVREFDPIYLRRIFAVVLQEVFLFSDTIAANIRLANPALTDEQVWDLLREVRADDFIRNLPDGIYTQVGERGAAFSTGQKQLLSFARALAADPQVLILDEATANIDTATEQRIQEATARLLAGRTALVIAHRISTIQEADQILVMHKARLRESGTHEELLAQDGLYRRLYEFQYRTEHHHDESVVEQAS